MNADVSVRITRNSDALVHEVSRLFRGRLEELSRDSGRIDVVIAGGFIVDRVLPAIVADAKKPMANAGLSMLGESVISDAIAWERVHVWWVDERFVPKDHPDRNDAAVRQLLSAAFPEVNIHPMPVSGAGMSVEEAASWFSDVWSREFADHSPALGLLGMGPDGHIASLFPGRADSEYEDSAVIAVKDSPKPPPLRLSLTMRELVAIDEVMIAVAGGAKAGALAQSVAYARGDDGVTALPCGVLLKRGNAVVIADAAASENLSS